MFVASQAGMTAQGVQLQLSDDLPIWGQMAVLALVGLTILLLFIETRRHHSQRWLVRLSGVFGALALALAVLRPSHLRLTGRTIPAYVMVLVDGSHRMDLPASDRYGITDKSRSQLADEVVESLTQHLSGARVVVRRFTDQLQPDGEYGVGVTSDLLAALPQSFGESGEMPQMVYLVSDGRLTRPGSTRDEAWRATLRSAAGGAIVHTIAVSQAHPSDRSLRAVGMTGSAVAHQPFRMEIEVGCEPQRSCEAVEVRVLEMMERQAPRLLATGQAKGQLGKAVLSLEVTLEQAGNRALLVQLVNEGGDVVKENDQRILPVYVRRDRLRMLHVAGRPTYDVRALRMFLKADESIDLISFFILRTESDQVQADDDELALIPFPVDELFSEHLSSFDAIILQDIDARRYRLDRHFRSMRDYVVRGGGLILAGGPTSFSSGGYAGSPLEEILPVHLPRDGELILRKSFLPELTQVGRVAPILRALRSTMGEDLPLMDGANRLGSAKEGALVLWEHPSEMAAAGDLTQKMPVLAVHEVGDGRSVAISIDGSHQLRFGEVGAKTGGRAHADLWEGLLGWLMRDPRFESARLQIEGECIADQDQIFLVDPIPGLGDDVKVSLEKLGVGASDPISLQEVDRGASSSRRFVARSIPEGGYAARVRVGAAPPTRTVIACEKGGEAWSDSRPDQERLSAIAELTGGQSVTSDRVMDLPKPQSSFISAQRESLPLAPAWAWAALAVSAMGVHWLIRRAVGYV
jgi:uncharacterized membrane protein